MTFNFLVGGSSGGVVGGSGVGCSNGGGSDSGGGTVFIYRKVDL